MDKNKFTKAAWEPQESLDGGSTRSIIAHDDQGAWQVASVNMCMGSESEANYNLILAVPIMFTAMDALIKRLYELGVPDTLDELVQAEQAMREASEDYHLA